MTACLKLGQGRPSSPKEGLGWTHVPMTHQPNQPLPVKRATAVTARSSQHPETNFPGLITVSTKYLCGPIAFPVGFGPNKDDHYYWFSSTLYSISELELYGNKKE